MLNKLSRSSWKEREAGMCERGLTGDGDEESDGGLCCSSSVKRNAAVMSRLQEGACLLMTQSPDPQAPPTQQPQSSLNPMNLFTSSNNKTFQFTHQHHITSLHFNPQCWWMCRKILEQRIKRMKGKQQEGTRGSRKTITIACSRSQLMPISHL